MLHSLPPSPEAIDEMPDYVRASGQVTLRFAAGAGRTQLARLAEAGGFRAKFPKPDTARAEAIIVNTAGGMTGGDSLAVDLVVEEGASAIVTTQAAEKIYKSLSGTTSVSTRLVLGPGSDTIWAPQETILFDKARLVRSLEAEIDPMATALICESIVFGRLAHGENLRQAAFRDRWRIKRGGKLIFADDVRLEGDIGAMLDRPAIAKGGRALAMVLLVAPEAEQRIDEARAALAGVGDAAAGYECAASSLPGLVIARFLAPDPAHLRSALGVYLMQFAGMAIPRSWLC
jgi:urease accessory protein